MEKLNLPDIDKLKKILKASGLASSYKRDNLLSNIKLDKNFAEKNIDNYTDENFAETLINFLESTQQIEILINLCQELESIIKTGTYHTELKSFKKRMEIFNIVIANLESNTELFYESYKQSLSHHDISIRDDFYPINSIENLEINKVIENINKLDNYKDNNFSLLDYFVGHLKLNIQDKSPEIFKKLDTWLHTYQLDGLINIINQPVKPENNQPCLLVAIENGNNLIIKAWFIKDMNTYSAINNNYTCCELITNNDEQQIPDLNLNNLPENLPKLLDVFLENIRKKHELNVEIIQVFLPYRCIVPVDTFLTIKTGIEYYLGAYYKISIGFSERIFNRNQEEVIKWINKCKLLKTEVKNNQFIDIFIPLENLQNRKRIFNELRQDKVLGTRLNVIIKHPNTELMEILYGAGIPLSLWVWENIDNFQEELSNIINGAFCLRTLSNKVYEKRREADEEREAENNTHIGNHLSFLCDDYDLSPPKHLLSQPN